MQKKGEDKKDGFETYDWVVAQNLILRSSAQAYFQEHHPHHYSCAAKIIDHIILETVHIKQGTWIRDHAKEWGCHVQTIYVAIQQLKEQKIIREQAGILDFTLKVEKALQERRKRDVTESLRGMQLHKSRSRKKEVHYHDMIKNFNENQGANVKQENKNYYTYLSFQCRKCTAKASIGRDNVEKLAKENCPTCGEEGYKNWILLGVVK